MQNPGTETRAQRTEHCSGVEKPPLEIQKSMNWEVPSADVRSGLSPQEENIVFNTGSGIRKLE